MYSFLFGPVPSRRLGMSLGVDLVPRKVCSLDCVYCEVGETTKLTTERMAYVPLERIKDELEAYFGQEKDPDYITFSGSGEPTLNIHLGEVLQYIKQQKPHIPVAILTNGTLMPDPRVRSEMLDADLVLPSLDAATQEVFEKINRPDTALSIEAIIEGTAEFRKAFQGKIWMEIFILPGYNDHKAELDALLKAIEKIQPDSVQLNTLDRPGTLIDLHAATPGQLEEIKRYWDLDQVEIIARPKKRKEMTSFRQDKASAILETISRRPCTLDDLREILGMHVNEINKYLDVLEAEGKVMVSLQERGLFYQLAKR